MIYIFLSFLKILYILVGKYYSILVAFVIHWQESATGAYVSSILNPISLLPHPIPPDCPSALALSALLHALNLDGRSSSHMVIYVFQCYSLKSSHPHLLPQSPKVCSFPLDSTFKCGHDISQTTLLMSTVLVRGG